MKLTAKLSVVLFAVVLIATGSTVKLNADEINMGAIFPQLDGWTQKGKPDIYNPDNLFEYIDGAADIFLSYDFRELAALTYENKDKHTFTVDIYRHGDDKNGFGIYSAEKPQKGDFIKVGTQGYYEKGILNFLKGNYYVKMSGFDLGEKDREILMQAANALAGVLKGTTLFPKALELFPKEGKIEGSERYIAENFMGHSFLHSAFLADYEIKGNKYEVFVIEAANDTLANQLIGDYLAFLEKKGKTVEKKDHLYRFQDPYYRSSGTMNIKINGNYVWGLFSKDDESAKFFIDTIDANLKAKKTN